MPRPISQAFSDLSLSDSDSTYSEDRSVHGRCGSEANHYPRAFNKHQRPGLRSRASTSDSGMPSLINTPASSVGTAPSMPSHRPLPSRTNIYSTNASATKSIDLVTPWSVTAPSSLTPVLASGPDITSLKSSASTLTSFRVVEADDISYKRHTMPAEISASQGSLKQLFRHDAVKASPVEQVREIRRGSEMSER